MKIAVTGSTGFIGSHLVSFLQNNGHIVIEIDISNGYDLMQWDLLQELPRCDVIIHLASKTFVPDSFDNPREFYNNNITVTINTLELARKWKAKVVYMSSYFYGPPNYIPVDEEHSLNPHNPYAQTKWMSEELCRAYSRDFDVSVISFRLFNIYGPNQTGGFLIPEIIQKLKTGIVELKDPRPKRDYIHIFDVLQAINRGLQKDFIGFNTYNLGTGKSYSVKDLVEIIRLKSKSKFDVVFSNEYRKGEVLDSVADISKLNNFLHWKPSLSLFEGIATIFEK